MIVDGWVNLFPESFATRWAAKDEQQGVLQLFGADLAKGPTVEGLLEGMDEAGVDLGVLTAGLSDPERAHRKGGLRGRGLPRHRRAAPGPVPGVVGRRPGGQAQRQLRPGAGAGPARGLRHGAGHPPRRAVRAQPPPLLPGVRHL